MRLHYFSQRLRNKLELTAQTGTVLIEAPSGYGKTTAVRDYLDVRAGKGARVFWFTAVADELPGSVWMRVCRVLEKVDAERGSHLIRLGVPTNMTVGEVAEELLHIQCDRETYVVLDDFHLIDGRLSEALYKAIFHHGGRQLHLIFIAQVFTRSTTRLARQFSLHMIRQEDLILYPADIREFFFAGGAELSDTQAEALFRKTGGWIIAICLQLKEYRETGVLEEGTSGDILQLMQQLEWDHLDEDCRRLLLLLSHFDNVTVPQVCHMLDVEWIPDKLWRFLNHDGFIRYEPQSQRYFPHVILLRLIRKKFERVSEEVRRICYHRSGTWYEKQGMQEEAMECFYQNRDWECILRLPHIGMSLCHVSGRPYIEIVLELLRECPAGTRKKYPITLLRFLYQLFGAGRFQEYEYYYQEFQSLIEEAGESDRRILTGEWMLMGMYRHYPKLDEMIKVCGEAQKLLPGGRSVVISPDEPFGFSCTSLWFLFHSKPGMADICGDQLEEFLMLYSAISNGRGKGGDSLYRGELACMRGDLVRAEILAHKAAAEGERSRQITICFGAALLFGRIALARGDSALQEYALSYLEKQKMLFQNYLPGQMVSRMEETVQSMLFSMKERQMYGAEWAREGHFEEGMMAIGSLMAGHIYITGLIAGREYTKAIGLMESMLSSDGRICTNVAKHYIFIGLAICYGAIHCEKEAVEMLTKALDLAVADGIIGNVGRFLPALKNYAETPQIQKQYGAFLTKLRSRRITYTIDSDSIFYTETEKEEVSEKNSAPILDSLSARECEVADLVAEGHSNKEIAQILCISEATVKYHLRTIFSKMQIDKRSKLVRMLKKQ